MMEVFIVHKTDAIEPAHQYGGGVVSTLNLLSHLRKTGVPTTMIGVSKHKGRVTDGNFTFIPLGGPDMKWYEYIFRLIVTIPSLKIPKSAIIHSVRIDFMLPLALLRPSNPKVCMTDEHLTTARTAYPGPIYRIAALLYKFGELIVLRRLSRIITVTHSARNYVKRHPWMTPKIAVMPVSGANLDKFKPLSQVKMRKKYGFGVNEKIVVFVGSLIKRKDPVFLLRAFSHLKKKMKNARLVYVGEGSEVPKVQKLIKELGVTDVTFLGNVPHDNLVEVLSASDTLAICSDWEGSPTNMREALASGVPTVGNDVGDVKKVIKDPLTGKVVPKEEKAFADGLFEVLNLNRKTVRKACALLAKDHSYEAVGKRIVAVYRDILREREAAIKQF